MATVDGLTKARMLEIEAASVVDGEVDVAGDLILTRFDTTTINAGNVVGPAAPNLADASETVKGIAEIATNAETASGLLGTHIVSPAGLKYTLDNSPALIDHETRLDIWMSERPVKTIITTQSTITVDGLDDADWYKITWDFPTVSVANVITARIRKAGVSILTGYDNSFLYGYANTSGEAAASNDDSLRLDNGARSLHQGSIEMFSLNLAQQTFLVAETMTVSSSNVIGNVAAKGRCRDANPADGIQLLIDTGTVTGYIIMERKSFL